MGQKAQAALRAFEARGMSPAKALRRALSKTADVLWDLALVTQSVTVENLDQDGVVESLSPSDLVLLLDGPDGAIGLATVDRQVLTGVIEVQTIQQVTQMPIEEDRPLTQTDAAMISPLLDGALMRMVAVLEDSPLTEMLEGFCFGAMLEDARAAGLLLDASGYKAFRADVDLALGRRKGRLSFILPERKPKRHSGGAGQGPGPHADIFSRVPARLDAVLSRVTLPLSKAQALKPGDMLRLSPDALDRVEVYAAHGQLVAKGRMGQMNGNRAVRLTWPVLGPMALSGPSEAGDGFGEGNGKVSGGLPEIAPQEEDFPDLPALGDDDGAEDLPELPAMDFESEAGDFDFGDLGGDSSVEDFDMDFGSAPLDIDIND
ncbi:flagellar motor switch protein FliM [Sagittula marina]